MAFKRFTETEFLTHEDVDRLEEDVKQACALVQRDPRKVAHVNLHVAVWCNDQGDIEADFDFSARQADRKKRKRRIIRNGQLALAGTGLRSDEEPEADYRDDFLAAPARR